ncbi:hypothetical protein MWMV2_MWMV2_02314 [Acinetobacter oleivorans]|uniref:DUF2059 domain-containing protein n=2 Tax=Acinetobacter oleivorans TaxID=1148157 RepID=UPI000DD00799|nr:DUF2059 domain-containing protein [Acinetobacter oleivorans]NUF30850.1 DUF2059 domain-containing protein [Acinetobacter oleivorans]CAI3144049.1 hypothetical protein MWMV12_MWMV12_02314 [Acinetobacter oleivorans]CAI3144147.1 hypothetical protein MWMV2_MWMV2_02314 [Acinetobacter oleivorans]CAI3144741.1 hypothetical protein MWMV3_MWMV3_02387 [Acinetobacter oleivorans]CAI3145211.1 hypothetical protein MWMV13_MWMV13_02386 [Acinetobacter oleivorans]
MLLIMMKKILSTLVIGLCLTHPTFAQPASSESVKELMKVTKSQDLYKQMNSYIEQMISKTISEVEMQQGKPLNSQQKQVVANFAKKFSNITVEDMGWEKLEPEFTRIYVTNFTQEEIDGLINFYKSPVGQAAINKMPLVMEQSMKLGQDLTKEAMPKIIAAAKEMVIELEKYEK